MQEPRRSCYSFPYLLEQGGRQIQSDLPKVLDGETEVNASALSAAMT
jgi:hypothetical protein